MRQNQANCANGGKYLLILHKKGKETFNSSVMFIFFIYRFGSFVDKPGLL